MTVELVNAVKAASGDSLATIIEQILGDGYTPVGTLDGVDIGQQSAGSGTVGICRVSGTARSGEETQPWSVVVKAVSDDAEGITHNRASSAQREMEFYSAGGLPEPQGGVRAALCYRIENRPDGSTWLWIEDFSDAIQPPWSPEQFVKSAEHLGAWNGYWSGDNLPDSPWMSRDGLRLTYFNDDARANLDQFFRYRDSPLSKRFVNSTQSDRMITLFDEAESILELTSGIPQVLSHINAMPKNLFPINDPSHGDITVGIDWASIGPERAGTDATYSLTSASGWLELPIEEVSQLMEPVFDAYCEGLKSSGWSGDLELVRLVAYAINGTAAAIKLSRMVGRANESQGARDFLETAIGLPIEEILDRWRPVMAHRLQNADRAVELAEKL